MSLLSKPENRAGYLCFVRCFKILNVSRENEGVEEVRRPDHGVLVQVVLAERVWPELGDVIWKTT